ncbi:hypothetical protein B0H15DRAFT_514098 [Mycena belliarum]|uniref:Uncharacterized protein n=1 Tax=Mycena belliarum TaxID=1033014 RepID=A0AAD6UF77_9AGAR|nr:hypothetical protein B0H15DRAFT_514098 [Mycena belliae]
MVKCTPSTLQDFKRPSHMESAAGANLPSLVRYMNKLQKPYSQYLLIRKAARKSFIRTALSIPLHVIMLPSPASPPGYTFRSMVNFETRVRSYLMGALRSYSSEDAIEFFWQRNQKTLDANQGQLPPLLTAHCESTLLSHHLDLQLHDIASPEGRTPYPYFGVSELSCFQCALYFQAYRACELGPTFPYLPDTRLPSRGGLCMRPPCLWSQSR